MGKVLTRAQAEKQGIKIHGVHDSEDADLFRLNPIALPFIFFGFFSEIFLIVKFAGTGDPYWPWCVLLLGLGMSGFIFSFVTKYMIFKSIRIEFQVEYLSSDLTNPRKNLAIYLFFIVFTIFTIEMILFSLQITLKYSFGVTDMYFYYIGAAIMEELFFRYFLTSTLYLIMKEKGRKIIAALVPFISALPVILIMAPVIAAIPFMMIHSEVYGNTPYLMIAMYLGGVVFGLTYLIHKDISINFWAHAIINYISVYLLTRDTNISVASPASLFNSLFSVFPKMILLFGGIL